MIGGRNMPFDPAGLLFSREHEWVARDDADPNTATVGITDYAQGELGDVVYVDLPDAGSPVKQFETFGEVESVKSVSDLFSPISGNVAEINSTLEDKPELVNEDPYGEGWMLRVTLEDERELQSLLSHDEYQSFLGELSGGD